MTNAETRPLTPEEIAEWFEGLDSQARASLGAAVRQPGGVFSRLPDELKAIGLDRPDGSRYLVATARFASHNAPGSRLVDEVVQWLSENHPDLWDEQDGDQQDIAGGGPH